MLNQKRTTMAKGKTPPGPRGDLLLGSALDFKDKPLKFINYVANAYGDVSRFRVGPTYWYLITHPEDIHDAITKRRNIFLKPKIATRLWEKFLGDGLLTTEGDTWKRQHSLVLPAFHRQRIANYGEVMVNYTHRMMDRWTEGEQIDIDHEMVGLTLEIVAKTLFDADVRGEAKTVGNAMNILNKEMLEHIHMPLRVPKWWPSARNKRKLSAIEDIEKIVRDVIAERRESGEDRGDLLSMLLQTRDESNDQLNDTEIRDQMMTIFFAGHETTAHAMSWAWYLLAKHPEVTSRLQADIAKVTGGERLSVPHLSELPYLEQMVKESLRFLPSVWIFIKEPTEDVTVRGFHIPKGVPVLISPYVTHHDPRWYPSPETFDPDRFSKERIKEIPHGAYFPFSGGQRICIGKSFAMMEMRLILGSMLQRIQPTVDPSYELAAKAELSLHPEGPLPVEVKLRVTPPDNVAPPNDTSP
jgi:cytochrome P450